MLTRLGTGPGGTACITVSGVGSAWETYGPVSIGEAGSALLTIEANGLVSSPDSDPFDVGPLAQVLAVWRHRRIGSNGM